MRIGGKLQTEIESNDDCFRCHRRKNCNDLKKLEYLEERKTYHVTDCDNIEPLNDDELAERIGK